MARHMSTGGVLHEIGVASTDSVAQKLISRNRRLDNTPHARSKIVATCPRRGLATGTSSETPHPMYHSNQKTVCTAHIIREHLKSHFPLSQAGCVVGAAQDLLSSTQTVLAVSFNGCFQNINFALQVCHELSLNADVIPIIDEGFSVFRRCYFPAASYVVGSPAEKDGKRRRSHRNDPENSLNKSRFSFPFARRARGSCCLPNQDVSTRARTPWPPWL